MQPAILILAAGSSSRMGQSKQLLVIDGKSLLQKAAEVALTVSPKVFLVLGANFNNHVKAVGDLQVNIIENKDWEKGMGTSLKAGISGILAKEPSTEEIILMVCDQPHLTANHLNTLVQTAGKTHAPAVASAYAGTLGVPALFTRKTFKHLLNMEESSGAKKILSEMGDDVAQVSFPGGEIDLDTRYDVESFLSGKKD
ncbi:MAG: nucleotidyltransferase family protein [Cyclobacteriaceae bacterium]|nr:nucleotidyltransferase family protein [Cyclobacteriaceae bacterium]